jgi:cardiolipin synthase
LKATSEFGAYLDPLADKALLMSIYVTLGIAALLPLWVVIAVVSRDIMILGAIVVAWLVGKPLIIHPLVVSKLNTLAQLLLATLVLASHGFGFDLGYPLDAALIMVAVLTGLSAAAYLAAWMRHMAS